MEYDFRRLKSNIGINILICNAIKMKQNACQVECSLEARTSAFDNDKFVEIIGLYDGTLGFIA